MEATNALRCLLTRLSQEVQRLDCAYIELDGCFRKEAERINRLDSIARIKILKAKLASQVNKIRDNEESSKHAFGMGNLFSSALYLFGGSLTIAAMKQENPWSLGLKLANKELEKKADFGTVMIAVKADGNLEHIETIAVSRLAREAKTTESDIISSYKSKGYLLVTPEELWEYLDKLKEDIKAGLS
jgi:hypothetical protein